ncbi:ABC transporter permease [Ruegeria sp. HKCCD6604]|uniref:ABC transporter permease n=1 Tax=Ruegeria sp. HKCCD6604 TaxID=2683000 RepID=UPI00353029C3
MEPGRIMLGVLLMLLIWEGLAHVQPNSVLFSGPFEIAEYINDHSGLLFRAATETLRNAALGFFWGNLAAVALACFVILVPKSEWVISALALLVFCIPLIASGPILRVLFGPGAGPQIALAALAVYYTTFLALVVGLRAISKSWTDLMAVYGRGRLSTLFVVRFRASLPYLFVGLQIAAPAAFLGAMIGEFTGAERGLGVLTLRAMRGLQTDATWALAAISASLAMLGYACVGLLKNKLTPHAPTILLSTPRVGQKRALSTQILGIVFLSAMVLVLWQGLMDLFNLNSFFAKRPADIWTFVSNTTNLNTLLTALGETLAYAIPGYLAGLALGAGLAVILTLWPPVERAIMPTAITLRAVPIITTAPLLVLAFGRGFTGTVAIVAVMVFFPTLVACLQGLRQAPKQIVDLFESYGAGRLKLLRCAQIPAMLPALFASARMAVPAALLAVTTAEWLATGRGIGVLMALTASTSNYNMLWSCVVLLCLAAVTAYAGVAWCEKRVLRVYASEQVV